MITTIQGSIHQGHEAFSEHSRGRQCAFMSLAALLFNRSNSVDLWTQTNIDDILCHGDRMYLHALTNKMVPDTNSLSVEDLPEVATSQNNFEYCLDFNKFYQGRIDRSFCGDGPFCSLKQVLINVFSDSSNAMLVLYGYVMAVIQKSDFLYLFDSHARNSLGIPDENGTAVVLKFSELDEFQNHVETLGHCLNVETFEITSVHMHANICAAFSEQSHINGEEKINELPVSGNKRKHAETKHCQTDEQKQATLAKQREAYQKKKSMRN